MTAVAEKLPVPRVAVEESMGSSPLNGFVLQAVANRLVNAPDVSGETPDILDLTDREVEVATLRSVGCSNQEIGKLLSINTLTVGVHTKNSLRRLGLRGYTAPAAIVRIAHRNHLFPPIEADSKQIVLTDRRKEILQLIAEGLNNDEIGKTLNLSRQTVKGHVTRILRDLGVKDRAHAVRVGLDTKVIDGLTRKEDRLLSAAAPFMAPLDYMTALNFNGYLTNEERTSVRRERRLSKYREKRGYNDAPQLALELLAYPDQPLSLDYLAEQLRRSPDENLSDMKHRISKVLHKGFLARELAKSGAAYTKTCTYEGQSRRTWLTCAITTTKKPSIKTVGAEQIEAQSTDVAKKLENTLLTGIKVLSALNKGMSIERISHETGLTSVQIRGIRLQRDLAFAKLAPRYK